MDSLYVIVCSHNYVEFCERKDIGVQLMSFLNIWCLRAETKKSDISDFIFHM